mmetsp:Transcript_145437/g.466068  ORF Transcript_145437/g.466068 Transcript_145437/m.466068 type:complete len:211 (+) Transcript_145437:233-865(+)
MRSQVHARPPPTMGARLKPSRSRATLEMYSEVYYTDTSCTTTDASRQAKESGVCTGGSNYYEDYTDCVDASTVSHVTYAQYTKAGCAAADKNGDGVFASAACVQKDDFESDVWVNKSESQVLSSDKKKLTMQSYKGASDCTGTLDGTAKVFECGVCQLNPGSTDVWLVLHAPGCAASGLASAAPPSTSRLAPLAAAVAAAAAAAVVQRVA